MTRNGLLAVALATCGALAGCGGDDDGPELRTIIRCAALDGSTCGISQWEVPVEIRCSEGYREVSSCPDTGILATCTASNGPSHVEAHVYDASQLDAAEDECERIGGTWTVVD